MKKLFIMLVLILFLLLAGAKRLDCSSFRDMTASAVSHIYQSPAAVQVFGFESAQEVET